MKILIKNGSVVDPANKIDQEALDILVENGKIAKVAKNIKNGVDKTVDAQGMLVIPGLVDMHVHLRQPGREDKETISSGTLAAAKGGVTACLAMPNTNPAMDCRESLELLRELIHKHAKVNVLISGAITRKRQGKELADLAAIRECGAVAISDDGVSVDDDKLFSIALKEAKELKLKVVCHCEDRFLSGGGVVNLGLTSTRLGLRGISKASEFKRVERDIELAEKSDAPVHIAHVSCAESIEIIARAKKKGVQVTCETAPHYFVLSEEAVLGYDTNMKMNPPLRSKSDVAAVKQGLREGIIDAIASDHAPHTENEKAIEFDRAEFGVTGLETELSAGITELVDKKVLDYLTLISKMSFNPAKILGVEKGALSVGADADIAIVSPDKEWLVTKEGFLSKSKNSAFLGRKLKGVVEYTLCSGKIVYENQSNIIFPTQVTL